MKPGEYDKNIDELISRAIGRERITLDFDKWRQDHQKEIQTYKAQPKKPSDSVTSSGIWRIIMKSPITKLAAAAVIIIAVGIFFPRGNGSSVAWAKVVEKVEQIESFMFQQRISINGMPEGATTDMELTTYVSSEYGLRQEIYENGRVISISYVPLEGTTITAVWPSMKKYLKVSTTQEHMRKTHDQSNPKGMIKEFMSFEHTGLGRKIIDGVEAEGIEVNDPNFLTFVFESTVGRLWVDVKTNLPLRTEIEGISGNGSIETKIVAYDFDWDVELDPGVFEPNIPDDYTIHGEIDVSDNEGAAIKGLRMFAELVSGQYPSNLDLMTASMEATKAVEATMADDPNWEPNMPVSKEAMEKITNIQAACRFYAKLLKDGKEAVYYGQKVTSEHSDMVLLRWKVSDNEYRVIFGNLTAENITTEQLAELENNPDFIKIMSEPRKGPQYEIASKFIGRQVDQWHINATDKIIILSHIKVTRWPQEPTFMEITLPYAGGVLESATLGQTKLQYYDMKQGRYELELPREWLSSPQKKIEVVWALPLDALERVDYGYRTVLKSLISVVSYKLEVILEPGSNFEYTRDSSKLEFVPFTWSSPRAGTYFGSCGITIKEKQ
ncbi:MAG: hypothetical protein ACYS32_07155 [Planctomycetota bacterium]|jgi:hypothetical protein